MNQHLRQPATLAILGADPVVENALALLLGGFGYDARVLEEPSAANAEEQLVGADLLLTASRREGDEEALLGTVGSAPVAMGVPVLALSTAPQGELDGRTTGPVVVPWPAPLQALQRAIEAALASAPSGDPGGDSGGAEQPPSKPAGHGGAARGCG